MRNVQVNHQMITNHFYLDFTWCHKWSKNQLFTVTINKTEHVQGPYSKKVLH